MNKFSFRVGRLLLSIALPVASGIALAQAGTSTELDRVDVSGRTVEPVLKFDVYKACPQIGPELQDSLGAYLGRYASPGTARVEFLLAGKEVSAVKVQAGLPLFGVPIKKAVRRLSCDSAQTGPVRYAFELLVLDADSVGNESALAQHGRDALPQLQVVAR